MAHGTRLQAVGEEAIPALVGAEPTPAQPATARGEAVLMGLLITSLRALSQRAIVALASLGDMALMASVFAIWLMIIQAPTVLHLVGGAIYAVFALVALLLRRKP